MKRRNCGFSTGAVLLVAAAIWAAATIPAMADQRPCKIPDHVKMRLEIVCDKAVSEGRLDQMETLDFSSIMRLMEQNKCPRVRFCALYSLGEIKDPRATGVLLVLLKDNNLHVRRAAAHSLGKIGDKRAVMPLIEILCRESESEAVQSSAALALGKLGDPRARRILTYLAQQETGWVQIEACKALMKFSPAEYAQNSIR